MKTTTNLRDIRLDRNTVSRLRSHGLFNRTDLTCPGDTIVIKNVPYAKMLKAINLTSLEVKNGDEWVFVKYDDINGLYKAYTNEEIKEDEEVVEDDNTVDNDIVEETEEEEIIEEDTLDSLLVEEEPENVTNNNQTITRVSNNNYQNYNKKKHKK